MDEYRLEQRGCGWLGEGITERSNSAGQVGRSKSVVGMKGGSYDVDTENAEGQMRQSCYEGQSQTTWNLAEHEAQGGCVGIIGEG